MANHKSALKRIRQTPRRTERNRAVISRMRTFIKNARLAIENGDKAKAQEAFKAAESEIAISARKGVIHRSQAARRISRLSAQVKALA